ncbi:unnamed protein product [Phyllotreta striolata]|uniref:Uncharacterized protein n=1 Tax=Phyllotreta striolata TaxID=444603 RepID=A0A9N9XS22_PHYSR|nr:unnamed protein product [Phyllotreta striolata]
MTTFKIFLDCMFTGNLYKYNTDDPEERLYQPSTIEYYSDQVINSFYIIWKFGIYSYYTSPALVGFLYKGGYFEPEGLVTLSKLVTTAGVILVTSYCLRSYCRANNGNYVRYMNTLKTAQNKLTSNGKKDLMKYDFDFKSWPVEYKCTQNAREVGRCIPKTPSYDNFLQFLWQIPYKVMAYFAIHTFGIRLIYPGIVGILQILLGQGLRQGRTKLIVQYQGERFKIETADNNHIDTMFVDKRNASPNGKTLVICCEGNAGFYEIGIMTTPIESGYSTLGWNHPGFANSTGRPYPSQEQNAMHALMQFAENKLGFKREEIILFGWSIGGYPASWAAMNYPEIKGIVLDATFDDVLPLACNVMPKWLEPIVKIAIRDHVDLNVVEQLIRYPGPILLIRRSEDEVICTRPNDISSNRINNLLMRLLCHRFPCIFDDARRNLLLEYFCGAQAEQEQYLTQFNIDDRLCYAKLQTYISENSKNYPMSIGEDWADLEKTRMALFLAKNYMIDFKATHCVPLPPELFKRPWDVTVENDFVHL